MIIIFSITISIAGLEDKVNIDELDFKLNKEFLFTFGKIKGDFKSISLLLVFHYYYFFLVLNFFTKTIIFYAVILLIVTTNF